MKEGRTRSLVALRPSSVLSSIALVLALTVSVSVARAEGESGVESTRLAFRALVERHGPFTVEWNDDGTPRRALGSGRAPYGSIDAASLPDAALRFVDENREIFRLSSSDLRLQYASRGASRTYVVFEQVHRGVPVAGSQIDFRFLDDGTLQSFGERGVVPGIDAETSPTLSSADAFDELLDALQAREPSSFGPSTTIRLADSDLVFGREDAGGRPVARLSWRVRVETESPFGNWVGLVDAGTGAILEARNEIYPADVTGSADGSAMVTRACWGQPLDGVSLPHLRVRVQGGNSDFTDATGAFSISNSGSSPVTLTADLSGRWVNVNNSAGSDSSWSGTATPGSPTAVRFLPDPASEFAVAQTNAYVHTTRLHDFVRAHIDVSGIDRAITCTVNAAGTCNAFYATNNMRFFRSGGGCNNAATASVIAHEYGHFVDDKTGGIVDDALTEGNGDVLSLLYTADPCEWRCSTPTNPNSCARDNSVGQVWPAAGCNGEPHCVGQTWAGFAWDVREGLIERFGDVEGARLTEAIFLSTFLANPANIPDAVLESFLADDDDGNLANGTPHGDVLSRAAARRGFAAPFPPTLVGVTPGVGGLCGGEPVQIDGTGFQRNATSFQFGGSPATVVSISPNGTRAVVRPPARPNGGLVSVTVTTTYGSASLVAAYEYRNTLDAWIREGTVRIGRSLTLDVTGPPGADYVVVAGLANRGSVVHGVSLVPGPARVIVDAVTGEDPRLSNCGSFSRVLDVPNRAALTLRRVYLQAAIRQGGALHPTSLQTYTIVP